MLAGQARWRMWLLRPSHGVPQRPRLPQPQSDALYICARTQFQPGQQQGRSLGGHRPQGLRFLQRPPLEVHTSCAWPRQALTRPERGPGSLTSYGTCGADPSPVTPQLRERPRNRQLLSVSLSMYSPRACIRAQWAGDRPFLPCETFQHMTWLSLYSSSSLAVHESCTREYKLIRRSERGGVHDLMYRLEIWKDWQLLVY